MTDREPVSAYDLIPDLTSQLKTINFSAQQGDLYAIDQARDLIDEIANVDLEGVDSKTEDTLNLLSDHLNCFADLFEAAFDALNDAIDCDDNL